MRRRPAAGAGLAAALVLAAAACTSPASEGDPEPAPAPRTRPAAPPATAAPEPDLAVVGHATRPQLALTRAAYRRLVAGDLDRWRGREVVAGIRAVERDPGAIAVVPLDDVGPTVVAARVGGVDPVRDDPRAVDLTVGGDVMLVRGVPDAAAALAPLSRRLRSADVTVGNLESTLSLEGSPTQGGDSFGGTPALLGPLRRAGFDVLSLANNHAGDYGTTAMLRTVAELRRSPVAPVGAGRDLAAASRPAYVVRGGVRFGFVAFNAIGETPQATPDAPGALSVRMPPRTGPLVPADLDHVAEVIRRATQRADVVVALPHWGTQYTHEPEEVQRTVGRRLVRAGADLVVGGHPHWVQGIDSVGGVPLAHSLGNLVFDMGPSSGFPVETREGVLLEATFWGAELKAVRLAPYRMDPTSYAPRPVPGPEVLADVWSTSTGPYAG
ncbi:CapA family protein [Nocardioides dongkuii]|uniref:CapA family protein n=1 Tax=Nocardioides dongkuii TaxID=2760089 RepID=UPI0015FCCDCF|nr:CapA family protein [Nocardioides dongkuii]